MSPTSANQPAVEISLWGVLWAVQPGGSGTRPSQMMEAIERRIVLSPRITHFYHGRTRPRPGWVPVGMIAPGARIKALSADTAVCFSPVFTPRLLRECRWVDFYDDWSLAPDINPLYRRYAERAYDYAEELQAQGVLVTCNSEYMARRLRLPLTGVVPNGVDRGLSALGTDGDDRRRLIVQGHFFRGRTDFDLLRSIAASGVFEEVVICAPGDSRPMRATLADIARSAELTVIPWLSDADLAQLVGPRTVALIPHVVSDYTLSQDLMKAYKYLALGMRVICPRLLWPTTLTDAHAYLIDFGAHDPAILLDWVNMTSNPSKDDRRALTTYHSWESRADAVLRMLDAK